MYGPNKCKAWLFYGSVPSLIIMETIAQVVYGLVDTHPQKRRAKTAAAMPLFDHPPWWQLLCTLISVIFTWFLVSSYLLKFLVFLYFFWFDLIFIYIYLFICALKEWEDFILIYKGFTCKVGARPIESNQLTSSQAWIQEKTNPIKFKSNWSKESKEICTKSKSNSD